MINIEHCYILFPSDLKYVLIAWQEILHSLNDVLKMILKNESRTISQLNIFVKRLLGIKMWIYVVCPMMQMSFSVK